MVPLIFDRCVCPVWLKQPNTFAAKAEFAVVALVILFIGLLKTRQPTALYKYSEWPCRRAYSHLGELPTPSRIRRYCVPRPFATASSRWLRSHFRLQLARHA